MKQLFLVLALGCLLSCTKIEVNEIIEPPMTIDVELCQMVKSIGETSSLSVLRFNEKIDSCTIVMYGANDSTSTQLDTLIRMAKEEDIVLNTNTYNFNCIYVFRDRFTIPESILRNKEKTDCLYLYGDYRKKEIKAE